VTGASVGLIVALGSMAAYALARFSHPLGRAAFGLIVAGLTVPAQLAIIPLFFELRALGLLNSRLGLVLVYTANGLPFAIFILAGFFRLLPRSLYEAAVVDGCGEFAAFWKVLLPLARPGLVTVAIFQFIGIWKEYFYAFMLVSGDVVGHGAHAAARPREPVHRGGVPQRVRDAVCGHHPRDAPDPAGLRPAPAPDRARDSGRRPQGVNSRTGSNSRSHGHDDRAR
jgi:hypothetical protein